MHYQTLYKKGTACNTDVNHLSVSSLQGNKNEKKETTLETKMKNFTILSLRKI